MLSEDSSDSEIAAAALRYYGRVTTYEVSGSTITYNRIIELDPNLLGSYSREFTIRGDRLETRGPPNAEGVYNMLRYVRVE